MERQNILVLFVGGLAFLVGGVVVARRKLSHQELRRWFGFNVVMTRLFARREMTEEELRGRQQMIGWGGAALGVMLVGWAGLAMLGVVDA
jgi:hypothetical protein